MKHVGTGTQKVEEELHDLFPGTEVLRMDADTAAGRHEQLLHRFEKERIPILLGTQMVAKGLDFPNVTLVGVLAADLSLYVDNYRAAERTFSLLTQVVGRAGRGGKRRPGGDPDLHPGKRCDPVRRPAGLPGVLRRGDPHAAAAAVSALCGPLHLHRLRGGGGRGPPGRRRQCGRSCAVCAQCRSWRPASRRCWVPPRRR